MLNTRGRTIQLQGGGGKMVRIEAVCMAISKDVPETKEPMDIKKGAPFWERFAKGLASEGKDYIVEQAAAWLKSDNANFKELGTLVDNKGQRLIDADDVVAALK